MSMRKYSHLTMLLGVIINKPAQLTNRRPKKDFCEFVNEQKRKFDRSFCNMHTQRSNISRKFTTILPFDLGILEVSIFKHFR